MFNFFRKNSNSETTKRTLKVEDKYSELISQIIGLSETYEEQFKFATHSLDENNYAVIIDFSGKINCTVAYCDTFLLIENTNELLIEWKRNTQSLLSFLPSILPEKIKHTISLDKNQSAETMFKIILEEITNYIGDTYDFADLHYDDVLESGNSKYISPEEHLRRDRISDDEMNWNMEN